MKRYIRSKLEENKLRLNWGNEREKREKKKKIYHWSLTTTSSSTHLASPLKVLVTPLPIPSRKAVFEHQKKSHAPPECGDFPHTLVHVLHVSATPWKLTSPIIFVLLLILVLQHLIVLHQYKFFYFSKPSINLALESSLDIMRSPYQDNQNKLLSQIPNKDNVKGWN